MCAVERAHHTGFVVEVGLDHIRARRSELLRLDRVPITPQCPGRATHWEKTRLSHHLSRMEKRELIRREESEGRYPDIVLTEAGRDAIKASAPANAARVRKLFVDVLGAGRLADCTLELGRN